MYKSIGGFVQNRIHLQGPFLRRNRYSRAHVFKIGSRMKLSTLKGPFSAGSTKTFRVRECLVHNSTRAVSSRAPKPGFRSLLGASKPGWRMTLHRQATLISEPLDHEGHKVRRPLKEHLAHGEKRSKSRLVAKYQPAL